SLLSETDRFNRRLLEECVKARQSAQGVLKMMFDMQEIKSDSRYNYNVMVEKYKDACAQIADEYFPSGK
ncbi:MAG: conjugal transfer protein TraM, partial [Hafnia sp.]